MGKNSERWGRFLKLCAKIRTPWFSPKKKEVRTAQHWHSLSFFPAHRNTTLTSLSCKSNGWIFVVLLEGTLLHGIFPPHQRACMSKIVMLILCGCFIFQNIWFHFPPIVAILKIKSAKIKCFDIFNSQMVTKYIF